MNRLAILVLWTYKKLLSPLLPASCRFTPTCSEYAIEAYKSYPFFQATKLSILRIGRCHPYHEGGYDPLPKPLNER
ncbi:membrane protein insertion efficiency factor YidD [Leptospira ryugenii]|uniref:membrane protein insertion efficiency factor YidD n=1 Tax=Leptospira ryugenii TaxID=1917863 RepID=UPI000D59D892|nr:membrane protein insertion efficiency factor YidD [Leptospira ryugenii]